MAEDAPFGLRWGATFDELKVRGVSGELQQDDGKLLTYQVRKLPKAPNETDVARLNIDRQFGLQRIVWVSKTLSEDPSGQKGLELYQATKQKLSEEYGTPRSADEEMAGSQTHGQSSFYQCLAEDGCGVFVTVWRTPDIDARLRLIGTAAGKGWLEIVFLGPDWDDVATKLEKKKPH
jgi:hypothetical protein